MERSPAVLQLLAVVRATIATAQQSAEEEIALEDIEQVCAKPRNISLGHAGGALRAASLTWLALVR